LVSGIKFLLEQTAPDVKIIIPCHSGNHGRFSLEQRVSTEAGFSLEHIMYFHLKKYFAGEPRIQFQIAEGYHTTTRLFDGGFNIRWHHGHQIKYNGGSGGITIPVLKSIEKWNTAIRDINLDVFGHFHQYFNAGNFLCNGSLCGYNDYAVSIKAGYEKPQQAFFLVNKRWAAKTMTTPIFVEG